jgi:hypothetical protein
VVFVGHFFLVRVATVATPPSALSKRFFALVHKPRRNLQINHALAIVSDAVEKDYRITVPIRWTCKPALKMAVIAGSDRNVLQSRTEPGGSSFG